MKKKNILEGFVVAIFVMAIIYLSFAFAIWRFDASYWTEGARASCVMFMLVLGGAALAFYLINNHDEK